MRRIVKFTGGITIALVAGAIVMLGSLSNFSAHFPADQLGGGASKISCSAACSSHSQAASAFNLVNKSTQDDKDPMPPASYLNRSAIVLSLLYVLPFIVVMYAWRKNSLYLEYQLLRF